MFFHLCHEEIRETDCAGIIHMSSAVRLYGGARPYE